MSASSTEQGSLSTTKPSALVLRWEKAKMSGLFRVECALGIGFTWFQEGRVIDCRIGNLTGEPAFCCLMGLRTGTYALQAGAVERVPTLLDSTSGLVNKYRSHAQSWQDLAGALPGLGSMLALDRKRAAQQGTGKGPEDKALLRLIDMRRRIHELVQESDADPRLTLERVARFLKLGVAAMVAIDAPLTDNARATQAGPVRVHGVRVISDPPANPVGTDPPSPTGGTVRGMPQVNPLAPLQPASGQSGPPVDGSRLLDSDRAVAELGEQRHFGRYELLCRLGRGGMGTVYLVRATSDVGFSRLFALKVLRSHLASDALAVEALLAEAKIVSRLSHANVVGVVDVGMQGSQPYVVMDYVHGMTLAELLAREPKNEDSSRIVPILIDALAGLSAAHTAKDTDGTPLPLIHHDVSPHNFLVGLDGVSRLTDFGVSRLSGPEGAQTNRGKPAFLSPERVLDGRVDVRSDIFAMGTVMWGALTGERLFDAGDDAQTLRNVAQAKVRPPSELGASPPCFDAICLKALQRDPKKRYQTAEEMLSELRTVAEKKGVLGSPAEVSSWVREAMGDLADVDFDDPGQFKKFSEFVQQKPVAVSTARLSDSGGAPGHTVPLPKDEPPSALVRGIQWFAAVLALGALTVAVLIPEDSVSSSLSRSAERAISGDGRTNVGEEALAPSSNGSAESPSTVAGPQGPALAPSSPGQGGVVPAGAALTDSVIPSVEPAAEVTPAKAKPRRRVRRRPRRRSVRRRTRKATTPAKAASAQAPSPKPGSSARPAPAGDSRIPDQRLPILDDPLSVR